MNGYIKRFFFKRLKRSDFIYSLNNRVFLWHELRENLARMRGEKIKSMAECRREIKACRDYWHCYSRDYYLHYELYAKKLSRRELLDYVPPFFFANRHQEHFHKGLDRVKLSDKLVQYRMFRQRGIRTPDIICVCKNGAFYDVDSNITDIIASEDFATRGRLFVKPTDRCGGDGIFVVDSLQELYGQRDRMRRGERYIVQRAIRQREDINAINRSCVNTLRVIVHEDERRERMEMKICIMRMGRRNAVVDNSAQGGISIPVSVEDGSFAAFATAEHGGGRYYEHPDSGFAFAGKRIAGWSGIKRDIEDIATRLVELRDVALDVAITDDGVVLIEYNLGYGIDHIQKTIGGVSRILNVYPEGVCTSQKVK